MARSSRLTKAQGNSTLAVALVRVNTEIEAERALIGHSSSVPSSAVIDRRVSTFYVIGADSDGSPTVETLDVNEVLFQSVSDRFDFVRACVDLRPIVVFGIDDLKKMQTRINEAVVNAMAMVPTP